ncbi:DUF4830 domain-containing protein [Paenibacillus sp. JDR-2]|uniref:DUF4830 domain-containing protein n=1 Tax=Paenibacillus sp. (strain JDR-2) TaxID=324057 RepID=UPI0001666B41|nr:DUF4830 domain-containing protein [Paenibacillus sp. JDR-2]ACT03187.1 hypothetical protein Pjdr2_4571 [Paenibacillus sp. JDR-2]
MISIKKIIVLFAFFCLLFLIGCSKETTEQNNVNSIEYIESFGWHVEEKISNTKLETKSSDPSIAAVVDLKPYVNEEVYITTYLLKEKQKTGKKIYANIYQANENIIGGFGNLDGWLPGVFSLKDKERLINEGTIDK